MVTAINKNSSNSTSVRNKLSILYNKLRDYDCTLIATHVAGTSHITADTLSRVSLEDSISINREVLSLIQESFATITVDRFATHANRVVDRYNSFYIES